MSSPVELAGKTVCITGALSTMTRKQASEQLDSAEDRQGLQASLMRARRSQRMASITSIHWTACCASLVACSSPAPSPEPPMSAQLQADPANEPAPRPDAATTPASCAQAPGFRNELITLPPEFAPDMPAGTEVLWFAPGMFDSAAKGYWSYVFSLDMPDVLVTGPKQVEELINLYYRGLIAAVGESRNLTLAAPAISATATPIDDDSYRVELTVPDAFGSGEDVALRLQIYVLGHCLAATARPVDSAMQAALESALQCLPCAD